MISSLFSSLIEILTKSFFVVAIDEVNFFLFKEVVACCCCFSIVVVVVVVVAKFLLFNTLFAKNSKSYIN